MLGGSTSLTDVYLQVKINGDLALLQALAKLMLEEEDENPGSVFDQDFINEKHRVLKNIWIIFVP